MQAIIKEPGQPARDIKLPDGGDRITRIESILGGEADSHVLDHGMCLLCIKQSKAKHLPPNCDLHGPLIFVGTTLDADGLQWVSLSDDQKQRVKKWIAVSERWERLRS